MTLASLTATSNTYMVKVGGKSNMVSLGSKEASSSNNFGTNIVTNSTWVDLANRDIRKLVTRQKYGIGDVKGQILLPTTNSTW